MPQDRRPIDQCNKGWTETIPTKKDTNFGIYIQVVVWKEQYGENHNWLITDKETTLRDLWSRLENS